MYINIYIYTMGVGQSTAASGPPKSCNSTSTSGWPMEPPWPPFDCTEVRQRCIRPDGRRDNGERDAGPEGCYSHQLKSNPQSILCPGGGSSSRLNDRTASEVPQGPEHHCYRTRCCDKTYHHPDMRHLIPGNGGPINIIGLECESANGDYIEVDEPKNNRRRWQHVSGDYELFRYKHSTQVRWAIQQKDGNGYFGCGYVCSEGCNDGDYGYCADSSLDQIIAFIVSNTDNPPSNAEWDVGGCDGTGFSNGTIIINQGLSYECHAHCATCTGPGVAECLTCPGSMVLNGNAPAQCVSPSSGTPTQVVYRTISGLEGGSPGCDDANGNYIEEDGLKNGYRHWIHENGEYELYRYVHGTQNRWAIQKRGSDGFGCGLAGSGSCERGSQHIAFKVSSADEPPSGSWSGRDCSASGSWSSGISVTISDDTSSKHCQQ